ncbi:hypothetical protein N7539_006339 [Penicillium diatomitis]|uniref:SprT-like domain-containing protein n=1 Tax=Penicillium diatomitis TaxID=2819901 RepID=A0A9W9X377_9EURO|nr:uncharacterized protein N7539_006339 [Penicillium diatomitis]KAJ5482893.1 hypothetical protein N7539_006339 [Penicillium diatomitis]
MARLNTSNPLTTGLQRQKSLKQKTPFADSTPTQAKIAAEHDINLRSSEAKTPSTATKPSFQSHSRGSSLVFDIFSEESVSKGSESTPPKKQRKARTLKTANVNSLLLPISQTPRPRPPVKLETDDYEKENDVLENTPEQNREAQNGSLPASPTRRDVPRPLGAHQSVRSARAENNSPALRRHNVESETEEDDEDNGFDSLDDFIVSDNEDPSFYETSASETEDEKLPSPPPPPPSSRRRLMRGRRPNLVAEREQSDDEMPRRSAVLDPRIPEASRLSHTNGVSLKPMSQEDLDLHTKLDAMTLESQNGPFDKESPQSESPFVEPQALPKGKKSQNKKLQTPPVSPRPSRLRSPTKKKVRIPATPHRESVDEFWSQEETNTWNDQHSPRKETSTSRKVIELLKDFDDSEEDNGHRSRDSSSSSDLEPTRKGGDMMPTTPKPLSKSAIKKAEAEKNRAAKARRLSFNHKKAEFAEAFLRTLDQAASGGEVSRLAESTGGVTITWSKTLNTTAGRARWKGERVVSRGPNGESRGMSKIKHHASIELAEKIIDNEYRLINTLAHEYCHLANYMVSNIHDNPHGASFKNWGEKCADAMRDHPLYGGQIHVTTKHSYEIDYKYVWHCTACGQEYRRHSKSIDTDRSRCGTCQGKLQQIKPKPRNVSPKKSAVIPGQRRILEDVTRNLDQFVI